MKHNTEITRTQTYSNASFTVVSAAFIRPSQVHAVFRLITTTSVITITGALRVSSSK